MSHKRAKATSPHQGPSDLFTASFHSSSSEDHDQAMLDIALLESQHASSSSSSSSSSFPLLFKNSIQEAKESTVDALKRQIEILNVDRQALVLDVAHLEKKVKMLEKEKASDKAMHDSQIKLLTDQLEGVREASIDHDRMQISVFELMRSKLDRRQALIQRFKETTVYWDTLGPLESGTHVEINAKGAILGLILDYAL